MSGHVDSSRVYELRRRRRWPDGRALVAAVAVLAVGGGVAAQFGHSPAPAAHVRVVASSHDVGVSSPAPAGSVQPHPAVTKLPKVHVLRSLYLVHRLFRVHRTFWLFRRYRRY